MPSPSMLLGGISGSLCLVLFDPLEYSSWWVYAWAAVGYSAFVFRGEFFNSDGPRILSKRNARPLSQLIAGHIAFLAAILGLIQIGSRIYPLLPGWMTDTFVSRGSSYSALDIIIIVTMVAIHFIERRWLYREAVPAKHAGQDDGRTGSPR